MRIRLVCPPFRWKTHSRRHHHSMIPEACETFCHTSLHIVSNKYKVCCCSSRPRKSSILPSADTLLLSILFSNVARLFLLNILGWNSHTSHRKWNPDCWFWLGSATLLQSWQIIESTDAFRKKRRSSMPKIMQIGSDVLKLWEVKRTGLGWPAVDTYATFHLVPHMRLIRQTILSLYNLQKYRTSRLYIPSCFITISSCDGWTNRRADRKPITV